MLQRLLRRGPLPGVGGEEVGHEVQEAVVRVRHALAQAGALGRQQLVAARAGVALVQLPAGRAKGCRGSGGGLGVPRCMLCHASCRAMQYAASTRSALFNSSVTALKHVHAVPR